MTVSLGICFYFDIYRLTEGIVAVVYGSNPTVGAGFDYFLSQN